MVNIDHFYITVSNLDLAIEFYEELLQTKITSREGDRWADFSNGSDVYFGMYNAAEDEEKFMAGNSPTLCLKTTTLDEEYARIILLRPKAITKIVTLQQPHLYRYFQLDDMWDNHWDVAEYSY